MTPSGSTRGSSPGSPTSSPVATSWLLYVDPFAREGKHGGAWMDLDAEPSPLAGRLPVVVIVLNAIPPAEGAPALLTPLDVRILFHEFGHALHVLLSDVSFPRIAGINVAETSSSSPRRSTSPSRCGPTSSAGTRATTGAASRSPRPTWRP